MPKRIKRPTKIFPGDFSLKTTGVTQSLMQTFLHCRKKAWFSVDGWVNPDSTRVMYFGNLVHGLLARTYREYHQHKEIPTEDMLWQWITKLTQRKDLAFAKATHEDLEILRIKAFVVAIQYIEYYYERDFGQKDFEHIEQIFDVPFYSFRLRGKIDGIFKDEGGRWLIEHKTKGRISEEDIQDALPHDYQNLFYMTAAAKIFGQRPQGVLYNIIRNPGQKKKQSETVNAFGRRLRKEVMKKPEHFFLRYEVAYTQRDLQRFEKQLLCQLEDFEGMIEGHSKVYDDSTACLVPYRCAFLAACSSGSLTGYTRRSGYYPELREED